LAHQQSTRLHHLLSLPSYVPVICQPSARILIPPLLFTRYISLFDSYPRPFALVLCCLQVFAHTRLPNPLAVVIPAMTLLVDHDIRLRQSPVECRTDSSDSCQAMSGRYLCSGNGPNGTARLGTRKALDGPETVIQEGPATAAQEGLAMESCVKPQAAGAGCFPSFSATSSVSELCIRAWPV
jgi:hypothetical protein